jgi:hypothetical protein
MPGDRFTLAEFPLSMVEIACEKCSRRGRLRKNRLIEQYGADIPLPNLLARLANGELRTSMHDPCGAYYVALKPVLCRGYQSGTVGA